MAGLLMLLEEVDGLAKEEEKVEEEGRWVD